MRIRRRHTPPTSLIDITNLVDVMFTVIIFFLATNTFIQEERDVEVKLPGISKSAPLGEAPKMLVINVRQDGSYTMSNRTVKLAELQQAVIRSVRENPGQKVLIRGDKQALHGHVAAAVLAATQAGVREANIGYELPR